MSLSILFWVIMLVWLIFGWWKEYVPNQPYPFAKGAGNFIVFVLLAILGWGVFGAPVK
jgi:hypothetical protein